MILFSSFLVVVVVVEGEIKIVALILCDAKHFVCKFVSFQRPRCKLHFIVNEDGNCSCEKIGLQWSLSWLGEPW